MTISRIDMNMTVKWFEGHSTKCVQANLFNIKLQAAI